eukprot:766038-Hanusia_phi.AAC.3
MEEFRLLNLIMRRARSGEEGEGKGALQEKLMMFEEELAEQLAVETTTRHADQISRCMSERRGEGGTGGRVKGEAGAALTETGSRGTGGSSTDLPCRPYVQREEEEHEFYSPFADEDGEVDDGRCARGGQARRTSEGGAGSREQGEEEQVGKELDTLAGSPILPPRHAADGDVVECLNPPTCRSAAAAAATLRVLTSSQLCSSAGREKESREESRGLVPKVWQLNLLALLASSSPPVIFLFHVANSSTPLSSPPLFHSSPRLFLSLPSPLLPQSPFWFSGVPVTRSPPPLGLFLPEHVTLLTRCLQEDESPARTRPAAQPPPSTSLKSSTSPRDRGRAAGEQGGGGADDAEGGGGGEQGYAISCWFADPTETEATGGSGERRTERDA